MPTLRELQSSANSDEAVAVSEVVAAVPEVKHSSPLQFAHCCGMIGREGNVSDMAMKHYTELVHARILEYLAANQGAGEHAASKYWLISIALGPDNQQLFEYDMYPSKVDASAVEKLVGILKQIAIPVVHELPVAIAILVRRDLLDNTDFELQTFPSLSKAIKTVGMQAAIYRHFAKQRLIAKGIPWWQRIFSRHAQKTMPTRTASSLRNMYEAQEEWLQRYETLSEKEWVDLKRAIVDSPDDIGYRVAFAAKLVQQQSWQKAIEWYSDLLAQMDCQISLLWRRANAHVMTDNIAAALEDLSQAIELAPDFAELYFQRARLQTRLEAWDKAAMDLNEAIRIARFDTELYYYRAHNLLQRSKPVEAAADFREALRLDPNFGYAHFHLGWLITQFPNQGNEAIAHLSRAIVLTGNDSTMRLHRSLAYFMQNKNALALADCEDVLAEEPDNAEAHGIRGRVLQSEGQLEESIAACTRAIELGLEHAPVYVARAICYGATDEPTLAAYDCEAALALEPDNALALQIHGRLKLQEGDLDSAMAAFHRARELAPDWAEPREQLSLVHRMKEDPQAAVDEMTSLIENQPRQSSHYVNRAFALTQLQNYAEAAKDFDKALELDSENEEIFMLRGIFRMNCQQNELALADFENVLKIAGDHDLAREYRGALLLQLRRYEEAIEDFAQLIAKYPEHHNAYSGRAFAFAALGKTDRAQEEADRLSAIAPELAGAAQRNALAANVYRLVSQEAYDAALEAADKIVAEYSDESFGYRLRAHVRWEREEYVEANEDYTRVIDRDGPTSGCLSSRGQVRAELGEWQSALNDLNESVRLARQAGESIILAYALNGRSLTFSGMEREPEAEQDFQESIQLCSTNPWAYYHRGIRKFNAHDFKEAKVMLELALEFNEPALSKRKKQRARAALDRIASQPDA